MKITHLATSGFVGLSLVIGMAVAPAQAGVDTQVNVSGAAYVKVSAKTTADTVKVGKKNTGEVKLKYHFKILNIGIPTTAYYANSFPKTFKKPSLVSANVKLKRPEYRSLWNPVVGKKQWQVRGKQKFVGDLSATIIGDARAKKAGKGYFYGGTYPCDGQELACTNAHALVRANVKK